MFCSACGRILNVKKDKEGRVFGICSCGFMKEIDSGFIVSQDVEKEKEKGKGILIETESKGFPHVCKK